MLPITCPPSDCTRSPMISAKVSRHLPWIRTRLDPCLIGRAMTEAARETQAAAVLLIMREARDMGWGEVTG